MWVWSLCGEDPVEEGMANHSRILVWRIPWTEEPDGLQSIGSQRVEHDWSDLAHMHRYIQLSSVTQSCPTLCNPMDCSTPGLPVHHQTPVLAQTNAHQINDDIQLSHPLLSPSPPALNLSQHQGFSKESVLHIWWPKYWGFSFSISPSNEYSQLISFRMDWLDSLRHPRDFQESSPTPQFKSINTLVLSFFYSPTLTSIHDHWKAIALTRLAFVS